MARSGGVCGTNTAEEDEEEEEDEEDDAEEEEGDGTGECDDGNESGRISDNTAAA